MLKFGIHSPKKLYAKNHDGFFSKRKFIALDLYDQIPDDINEDKKRYIQERILNRFAVSNKTFKYTHADRFDVFDNLSLKTIEEAFPSNSALNMHDVAVSDGRTCINIFKKLNTRFGKNLTFTASEYAPYFYVFQKENHNKRVITDEDLNILQIVYPPFVFNCIYPENKKLYPLNFLIRKIFANSYATKLIDAVKQNNTQSLLKRELTVLHADFQNIIDKNENAKFMQYDLISAPHPNFEIIRAMNILNHSYFDEERLKTAIANIYQSLTPNGLFITGSNLEQGSIVNGGIYQKTQTGFKHLQSSGEESPVAALIEGYSTN